GVASASFSVDIPVYKLSHPALFFRLKDLGARVAFVFSLKGLKLLSTSIVGVTTDFCWYSYGVSRLASRSKSSTGAILNCPRLCFIVALKIAYKAGSSSNFISVFVG